LRSVTNIYSSHMPTASLSEYDRDLRWVPLGTVTKLRFGLANRDQFDVEDESGMGRDVAAGAAGAVAEFGGDVEAIF